MLIQKPRMMIFSNSKRGVSNAIADAIKNALDFRNFSCSPYLKCMNIECGHMIRIESNPSDGDSNNGLHSGYNKAKQIVVCGHCNKGTFLPNIAEPTRMACERRFFSVIKEQQKRFFKDEIDAIEMGPLEVDALDEEDELGDGYMYADGRLPTYSDARFSTAPNDTPDFCVGDRVMALWKDGTQPAFPGYFPGVVVRINPRNLSYAILYDDGYMDRHVKRSAIRKGGDATASPESTRLSNRQESSVFSPTTPPT